MTIKRKNNLHSFSDTETLSHTSFKRNKNVWGSLITFGLCSITTCSLIRFVIDIRDQQLDRDIIPRDDCTFLPSKIYSIIQAVVVYYIPILVVLHCYLGVTNTLYQRDMKKKKMKKNMANMFSSPKHKLYQNNMLHERNSERKDQKRGQSLQFDDIINAKTTHEEHHGTLSRQRNRTLSENAITANTFSIKTWRSCSLPSRWPKPDDNKESGWHLIDIQEEVFQKVGHVNAAFQDDSPKNIITEMDPDHNLNNTVENMADQLMDQRLSINVRDEVLLYRRKTILCNYGYDTLIQENRKKLCNSPRHQSFSVYPGEKEVSVSNKETVKAGKSATAIREIISCVQNDDYHFASDNNHVRRVGAFNDMKDSDEYLNTYDRKQSIKTISNIQLQDMVHLDAQGMVTNIIKVPPRKKYLEMSVPFKKAQTSNSQLVTQRAHDTRHRRITRTLGIIILVFLICWSPFCIAWPLNTFCECINVRFYDFTYWAAYINSTLNPFLYFAINRDFRSALKRATMKYFSKNSF